MEITSVTLKDNTIYINGTDLSATNIYIDYITPTLSILSSYTSKTSHDITVSNFTVTSTLITFVVNDYTNAGIIVTIDSISIPVINFFSIYKAKKEYLSYNVSKKLGCRSCDEKRFNSSTLALLLRDNLLKDAYNNSKWNDVITYYNQLSKSLIFNNIIWDTYDNDTITYIELLDSNLYSIDSCCDQCSYCNICGL